MSACADAIPSNPDIDGLGIRLATYLQLIIGIATLAISPSQGIDSWWAVIITSLGLQIAAIADYQDLSLYHGLIVTWITFPVFIMSLYYGFLAWGKRHIHGEIMVGTALHLSLYVAFCLWLWSTVHTFGQLNQCNDQVKFGLFVMLRPTGWVRYLVLYIVGIWAFAVAGMWIGCCFVAMIICIAKYNSSVREWWLSTTTPKWRHPVTLNATIAVLSVINLVALILAVIMIERMVVENADIVQSGSDKWTFGQIIAMILVAGPLITLGKIINEEYRVGLRTADSLDGRPVAFLIAKFYGHKTVMDLPVSSRSSSESSRYEGLGQEEETSNHSSGELDDGRVEAQVGLQSEPGKGKRKDVHSASSFELLPTKRQ